MTKICARREAARVSEPLSHHRKAVAAVAASAALLAAAISSTAAPNAGAVGNGCASLQGLKSFRGDAGIVFNGTATGQDTAEGGAETIALGHSAQVQLDLTNRHNTKDGAIFSGRAFIEPVIKDTFANTGTGFNATESIDGSRVDGFALLAIDSRAHVCRYVLIISSTVNPTFAGDEQIAPGDAIADGAFSGWEKLPGSFDLSGKVTAGVWYDVDCSAGAAPPPCYSLTGGWSADFALLTLCHSVETTTCNADPSNVGDKTKELGSAEVAWILKPTFAKPKHK